MILTISSRRLTDLIRSLENITDTDAEIDANGHRYGHRLGQHLLEFGIIGGQYRERGQGIADWQVSFTSNYDPETAVSGLKLLNPVNISLQFGDLPKFIGNSVMLGCAREAWSDIEGEFQRIQPDELIDKLERVLGRVAFAPVSPERQFESELTFSQWCQMNGLREPGAAQHAYDRRREEEILQRQKEERERYEAEWGDSRV